MVALQSKMTVYAALAAMLALMGGIIYYASLDNVDLEKVEIHLTDVVLSNVNTVDNKAEFDVTFLVSNPSEKTFTVSVIQYQLWGGNTLLGSAQYSNTDRALPGRVLFYPDAEIPLKSTLVLSKSTLDEGVYQSIIDSEGKFSKLSAEGSITTESSWSTIDKEFKTELYAPD